MLPRNRRTSSWTLGLPVSQKIFNSFLETYFFKKEKLVHICSYFSICIIFTICDFICSLSSVLYLSMSYRNAGSSGGRLAGTSPPPSDRFLFRRLLLLLSSSSSASSLPEFESACSFNAVRSMVSSQGAAPVLLLFSWQARRPPSFLLPSLCCCSALSGLSGCSWWFESLSVGEQEGLSDFAPSGRDREERMQSSIGNNLGSGGEKDCRGENG